MPPVPIPQVISHTSPIALRLVVAFGVLICNHRAPLPRVAFHRFTQAAPFITGFLAAARKSAENYENNISIASGTRGEHGLFPKSHARSRHVRVRESCCTQRHFNFQAHRGNSECGWPEPKRPRDHGDPDSNGCTAVDLVSFRARPLFQSYRDYSELSLSSERWGNSGSTRRQWITQRQSSCE